MELHYTALYTLLPSLRLPQCQDARYIQMCSKETTSTICVCVCVCDHTLHIQLEGPFVDTSIMCWLSCQGLANRPSNLLLSGWMFESVWWTLKNWEWEGLAGLPGAWSWKMPNYMVLKKKNFGFHHLRFYRLKTSQFLKKAKFVFWPRKGQTCQPWEGEASVWVCACVKRAKLA